VQLHWLVFADFLGDVDVLAAAAAESAGSAVSPGEVANVLRSLDALPVRDDVSVLGCVSRFVKSCADDRAKAQRAVEGMLGRLVQIDGTILRPETRPDVPLRESLRIVLDWAQASASDRENSIASGRSTP
jgi:hypothetical protein